ncbi:MAG: phenylacetate-CoA oxygenase subunit PaaC [Bacteroidetes bacterium]|jgi:ring-1,2-phenylacetyl-CoA epoxidase subunit PaaC|nr:phenylacetate-CoA oxygenase subunit PaaC [Bacteroidota bacterium]
MSEALKHLLYPLADDLLIMGHRNSEWTGLGPVLEEDIAFSSMAQDKLGHSLAFYELLHALGEPPADMIAFNRKAAQFYSCQLVEYPIGAYDFSLIRHLLFDLAYATRLEALKGSSYAPVAALAARLARETKYHTLHARTWVQQLAQGTAEGRDRLQRSLDETLPMAYSIFEVTAHTQAIADAGLQAHEDVLLDHWLQQLAAVCQQAGLVLPTVTAAAAQAHMGGRTGLHTEHLQPLLDEMTEVFRLDPEASW